MGQFSMRIIFLMAHYYIRINRIYTREVAQPIIGEGLREGVKYLKGAFKSSWEAREEREERDQEKYRAKMRMEAEGLTKKEAGRYEFSGGV
jgi:hypothetical protein